MSVNSSHYGLSALCLPLERELLASLNIIRLENQFQKPPNQFRKLILTICSSGINLGSKTCISQGSVDKSYTDTHTVLCLLYETGSCDHGGWEESYDLSSDSWWPRKTSIIIESKLKGLRTRKGSSSDILSIPDGLDAYTHTGQATLRLQWPKY